MKTIPKIAFDHQKFTIFKNVVNERFIAVDIRDVEIIVRFFSNYPDATKMPSHHLVSAYYLKENEDDQSYEIDEKRGRFFHAIKSLRGVLIK